MISKTTYLDTCEKAYGAYEHIEKAHPSRCAPERTYFRDIRFSIWHRSLASKCYTIDLDFIEDRNGKPVMIYDTKLDMRFDTEYKFDINNVPKRILKTYKKVADAIDIPFCVLIHNKDMSKFVVYHIDSIQPFEYRMEEFSESDMRNYIESL